MVAVVKAVTQLRHASGLPQDVDENTFVFSSEDTSAGALVTALEGATVLQRFFLYGGGGGGHAISEYLGNSLPRTADYHTIEYFDIGGHLDGSAAGPPIHTSTFTLGSALSAVDLPAEAAAVITLYGNGRAAAPVLGPVSSIPTDARAQREGAPATHSGRTRPKSSHTGRLYIGPLNGAAIAIISGEARLTAALQADFKGSATRLRSDVLGLSVPSTWDVWSRRLASTDLIIGGAIDNAPDTQHRRGVESTVRTLWP